MATKRLDAAISKIKGFSRRLATLQEMLAEAEVKCRPHFEESCFWNDNGCAQECMDQVAESNGWRRLATLV